MPDRPTVVVEDLTVRYGNLTAVDNLSLAANAGEITALLGPNGAGKTTTVETLEGYRRGFAGRVEVLGLDPIAQHAELTRRIGVMLQSGGVYTGIHPAEILRLFASFYDDPLDPDTLLARVGLEDRRSTSYRKLSGGEQQRLSLALALIGRPTVAFLDEPTAGIDVSGRNLIRQVITDLRDEGVCVLLTTHDLDDAEALADRVAIIDHGRLLAEGTPAELTRGGTDEVRFGAPTDLDIAELGELVGAAVTEPSPGEYVVHAAGNPDLVAALTAWLARHDQPLADLRVGRQRLEDVFLKLTGEASTAPDGQESGGRPARQAGSRSAWESDGRPGRRKGASRP